MTDDDTEERTLIALAVAFAEGDALGAGQLLTDQDPMTLLIAALALINALGAQHAGSLPAWTSHLRHTLSVGSAG